MAVGDKYRAMHARSLTDPEGFWAEQAATIARLEPERPNQSASVTPITGIISGAPLAGAFPRAIRLVQ